MRNLIEDIRFAARSLRRSRAWALTAIATLALGIGAATAIFSVVRGVLLRPLPYPDPDRIVQVWRIDKDSRSLNNSDPNFEDWRAESRSFAALAQYSGSRTSVTGGREPMRAGVAFVSHDFFDAMGVRPMIGRTFLGDELRLEGAPAVVVSHAFWRDYLGASPDLSGRHLAFANKV